MTNDDQDVLHHLTAAEYDAAREDGYTVDVIYHVGAAIAFALLMIARELAGIRREPR